MRQWLLMKDEVVTFVTLAWESTAFLCLKSDLRSSTGREKSLD
jgi:hypothetical protein